MVESYKFKSKLTNAIVFLASFISYLGRDGLNQLIPIEYANYIPLIILIAGFILVQKTENKRVDIAEQLIKNEYTNNLESDSEDGENDT